MFNTTSLGGFINVSNERGVNNQYIINFEYGTIFQSYKSIIAIKRDGGGIILGPDWDLSKTTGKYRNVFLNENKKETEKKIASGEYRVDETL